MAIEIPRFPTTTQADLIRETEPHRMDELDVDALIELRVGMNGACGRARPGKAASRHAKKDSR